MTSTAASALFVRASDPETPFPDGDPIRLIRDELHRLPGAAEEGDLAGLQGIAASWAGAERERFGLLLASVDGGDAQDALVRRAVLACAPLALRCGAWLQWMSAPGNADDPLVLHILSLYASDVGVGHPLASRGNAYLALLVHLRIAEHAVPVARLAGDRRIADRDFTIPALLLAMSRRPDDFRPEILGADLCLRTVGLLPALAMVRQLHPAAVDWVAVDPSTSRQPDRPTDLERSQEIAALLLAEAPDRVLLGFRWAFASIRAWSTSLLRELDEARDPGFEMAELLRLRAREGAIYHKSFTLQGKTLSEWLQASRTDPRPLLDVLASSKMVKPGRAEKSSLVNALVGEKGPMFRVFAPEDLVVIKRWINSLPATSPQPASPAVPTPELSPDLLAALDSVGSQPDQEPRSIREAYHLLQRRSATPVVQDYARRYVHGWLARARHGLSTSEDGLPERWTPAGLRPWLLEQHDRHDRDFEAGADVPVPSKEALIDSTIQLAPLTLIDGAWLQGFTDYEHVSSEQGHFLFETYWDELGNGEARLNHPLIYRQVLAEMDVEVPPTASREFAQWQGFRDTSFELPVYWLSIGRFPRTFLPELLGLNLAMELSGVGGSYRRARIALKKYGFSTRFVDIHNTIDNVATGHSAWAADAVDAYLASVPLSAGPDVLDGIWGRVRVGFRSLNPPSGYWARKAFRRASKISAGKEKDRD
jgi:hypothetical protein